MRYRSYESTTPQRFLTYFFYVVVVAWLFVSAILGYQFLMKNSKTTTKKGGTFVEAIFNEVSYLPYLKSDGQSLFYQSFLFDSCVDTSTIHVSGLNSALCSISTQDHQTYFVKTGSLQKMRSDGKMLSMDDVFFTYDTLLKKNIWAIKSLSTYNDVQILRESDGTIKLVFPTSTTDNDYFFTYYILPKHILQNADLNQYKSIFAANPITSGCGKIAPRVSDKKSLVFDLTKCQDTNFSFYQIKNYDGFEILSKSVLEDHITFADAYANQVSLPGYKKMNVVKNQLLALFFNTKSPKMKVRFRRAFSGLINSNFYGGDYSIYLKKYTQSLFSLFLSDGSNIKEFLNRLNQSEESENVLQEDLWDSGVSQLPKTLSINGVERKFVFHISKPTNNIFNLDVRLSNQFENIQVINAKKHVFSPKNYKKFDKKFVYPLEVGKNLKEGLNQYTIQGSIKGKKYTIAYIDLYVIGDGIANTPSTGDMNLNSKVKIVYYNNLDANFAIKQLRDILTKYAVLDFFLFEQVSSPEELEGKLILGDYDIILHTINIGMKKDILKILTTNDPLVNPSQYTNPNLTQLFKQYTKSINKHEFAPQINQQFAIDAPFVILGYPYHFINIKNELLGTGNLNIGVELYENNRRKYFYKNAVLMWTPVIDFSKLTNFFGFIAEIRHLIGFGGSAKKGGKFEENILNSGVSLSGSTQHVPQEQFQPSLKNPASIDPFNGLIQPAQ